MAEAASVKHYSSTQSILVVGRGDFSFSRSLATAFCSGKNLVSTSLDSYEELSSKYTEAELNITILNAMGATILHGVDAKTMKHHFALNMRRFDRIVFNFPHAGFNGKRENDVSLIESHKHLVRGFFDNARHLFGPYGEIHVSHKIGLPYDEWNIEQLASESSLIMVEINFNIQDYPGYNNKRGDDMAVVASLEAGQAAEAPAAKKKQQQTKKKRRKNKKKKKKKKKDGGNEEEEGAKWLKHYSSTQSILVVGDGDFSFSRALAIAFCSAENLVSTSLDTYEALKSKYAKAESNIMVLNMMGATTLHGVDAKTMKLHTDLKMRRFDRIVFNFPHAGFKGDGENDVHRIKLHKDLMREFFRNARHLLRPSGEIHVNHKEGKAYGKWKIEQLASESSLIMVEKVDFHIEDYPGYINKRGDGPKCDKPFLLGPCSTFKFCVGDLKKQKKGCTNKICSTPSLAGSQVHPEILASGWSPSQPFRPVNAVNMPAAFDPYSLNIVQRHQPGFPVNFLGLQSAASCFLEQGNIHPMLSIVRPSPYLLPIVGGFAPRMDRITSNGLFESQGQPRSTLWPWQSVGSSYFVREFQIVLPRDLRRKYSKAESNVMELKRLGATVLHGIDAKRMKDHTSLKLRRFDRIVFNFPHAGFKGKEDDMRMINSHRELVWGFFQNARHLLRPYGEIHVSHKIGRVYDRWRIEHLAYESSLVMIARVDFRKEDYPGYNQKRGDSAKCDQPFDLDACCTFMFTRDLTRLKRVHGNRIDAFSSLGSQVHHDIPFQPLPLVPAYPRPHFPSQVNAVQMQVPLELYPLGIAHRQQPGFPDNFGGIHRDFYVHQHDAIRPVFGMPRPPLNVLPPLDGTPPMSRITRRSFHEPQEQPWRQEMVPEVRDGYHRFVRECPRSLQEEYEMRRQAMPGGISLRYIDFLENRFDESVQRQEQLRRKIRQYGGY
uniref:25S rRNA (uridine-N(3))-methyltransferase BMT5-like domain-containing protein n=1 Tax=Leersia perrieri TaxID=77586 RepID=A0A0D9XEW0_9ORYZ